MRKVTQHTVNAFLEGRKLTEGNTRTDGDTLLLHDNAIAQHRHDQQHPGNRSLWITLAGWNTQTTRERLNGLPGVRVTTKKGQTYLNGQPWDGSWTAIK